MSSSPVSVCVHCPYSPSRHDSNTTPIEPLPPFREQTIWVASNTPLHYDSTSTVYPQSDNESHVDENTPTDKQPRSREQARAVRQDGFPAETTRQSGRRRGPSPTPIPSSPAHKKARHGHSSAHKDSVIDDNVQASDEHPGYDGDNEDSEPEWDGHSESDHNDNWSPSVHADDESDPDNLNDDERACESNDIDDERGCESNNIDDERGCESNNTDDWSLGSHVGDSSDCDELDDWPSDEDNNELSDYADDHDDPGLNDDEWLCESDDEHARETDDEHARESEDDDYNDAEHDGEHDSLRDTDQSRSHVHGDRSGSHDDDGDSGLLDENDNITRFETRFRTLILTLTEWCKDCGSMDKFKSLGDDQPISRSAFALLIRADPQLFYRELITHIPHRVKALFGRESLTVRDLAELPRADSCRDGGCYLEVATQGNADHNAGVYAGSSAEKKAGISRRVRSHRHSAYRLRTGKTPRKEERTMHYAFTSRPGVSLSFFVLARMDQKDPKCTPHVRIIEALFQAYLNLVRPTNTAKH
jgi:hypothetical protein